MGKIAERRQLTVMFVDLVNSTRRLNNCDPEEFFEFILKYQSRVKKCVAKAGGFCARFVGDGVLIYYGWPTSYEDSSARAIRSAREIVADIGEIIDPQGEPAAVRIGISTGMVIIGEIQTQFGQPQVEVFGEAPHLANRLQSEGAPNTIIVCQETKNLAHGIFEFEKKAVGKMKGIEGVWSVNQVTGECAAFSRFVSQTGQSHLTTIGREKELNFIKSLWPLAMQKEGQIVCISGDIGYGKSHLVEAVQKDLRREIDGDISVVRYQCSEHFKDNPYYPFVRRTDIWAGIVNEDDAQTRLNKFVSKMGGQPDEEMLQNISPVMGFPEIKVRNKYRSLEDEKEAVKKSIMKLAQLSIGQVNSLSIVEDLHWADPSTQELVRYFYDNIKDLRTLMLVTCRDPNMVPRVKMDNHHHTVLVPLTKNDASEFVTKIADDRILNKEMIEHIVEKTDGIPLYIEAYTKALLEPSTRAVATSFQAPISVPSSLNNILLMRLDHLGDLKDLAQICSTIGHEFSSFLVAQISGISREKAAVALDALTEEKILIRLKHKGIIGYRFRHALMQQIAYEGQLKRTRKKLHLKIAHVLENMRPHLAKRNPSFIAKHFSLAGLHDEATRYTLEAAQNSMSQFANREALGYAKNGLEHLSSISNIDEREEFELEFQMINALAGRAVNGFAKQSTIIAFERMMQLSLKRGSERHHGRAIRGLFVAMHSEGRYDDALAMAGRMINASGKDAFGLTTAHHMHAIPLIWQGKFIQAKDELELASDYYKESAKNTSKPRIQALARIQFSQSLVFAFLGHVQESEKRGIDALRNLKKTSAALEIANGYLSICNAMRIIRHRDLLKTAREFEVFIADHELPYYSSAISAFVGLGLFEEGDKKQGLELLKRGWQQFTQTQSRLNQVFYMAELADCNLQTDNLGEARIAVENGFALMEQFGERNFEAELYRIHGEIMLAEKIHSAKLIIVEFEKAIEVAIKQSAGTFEIRARNTLARAREELSALVE